MYNFVKFDRAFKFFFYFFKKIKAYYHKNLIKIFHTICEPNVIFFLLGCSENLFEEVFSHFLLHPIIIKIVWVRYGLLLSRTTLICKFDYKIEFESLMGWIKKNKNKL